MCTPLTNIIMPLELVVNKKFADPEEQIRFIRMAISSVDRLDSLVNDFILMTNIDYGNLNTIRQPIDIKNHLLLPVQKRLARYQEKKLDFRYQFAGAEGISAPRREFTHAVVHLLDNAFKFTPAGGTVNLLMNSTADGGAVIVVENDGATIPNELREKVFERFYQISQGDSREHEGLGVGLFIARNVFRKMGGDVVLLDSIHGCRVQAVLPDRRPEDILYG
jgi:two-component system cell cycle sensor histidine kinase PleC